MALIILSIRGHRLLFHQIARFLCVLASRNAFVALLQTFAELIRTSNTLGDVHISFSDTTDGAIVHSSELLNCLARVVPIRCIYLATRNSSSSATIITCRSIRGCDRLGVVFHFDSTAKRWTNSKTSELRLKIACRCERW